MMRSLFAGVSGLKVHQTRMDSIGNNIANINTVGFKSSRTTFSDMLSQTQSGAAAPTTNVGGTNPKQIGLGVSVSSIDLIFTDGSPQATGKNTDLALSGNGLFVVKDGDSTYYTRDGAFSFDENGYYVLPGSGYKVQGWNAVDGSLNTNSQPTDIIVPAGKTMPAAATSEISFSGNLNANEPLITAIDDNTQYNSSYTVPEGKISILSLSDGTTVTVTSGKYTIGHSVPKSTILQAYDSEGMPHNVPIQLEKTAANTWMATLSNLVTASTAPFGTVDNMSSTMASCYSYIKENDGTYTRVSFVDNDTNSMVTCFKFEFTSSGESTGKLTCSMRLEYNFDPYPTTGTDEPTHYIQRAGSYFKAYMSSMSTQTYTTTNRLEGSTSLFSGVSGIGYVYTTQAPVNGADVTEATVNFQDLTQYKGSYSAYPKADGNVAGTLVSVSVDTSGVITGTYTNGMNRFEAQVSVAQFSNSSGLTKVGNSLYSESNNSGPANIKTAPDLGLTITPSALEMSNVDLANEFSEMIITQRGFQANSKIINVGDEMLETLVNMKR